MKKLLSLTLALIITVSSFAHYIKTYTSCWTSGKTQFQGTLFDGAQNVKLTLNTGYSFNPIGQAIVTTKYITTGGTNSNSYNQSQSFIVDVYQTSPYTGTSAKLTVSYADNNGSNPANPANDNYTYGAAIGDNGNTTTSKTAICVAYHVGLPVVLVNYSVSKSGDGVVFKWTTTGESNNSYFNLQGSTDAVSFKTIAKVNSWVAGSGGNTNISHDYIYTISDVQVAGFGLIACILIVLMAIGTVKHRKTLAIAAMLVMGSFVGFTSCKKTNDAPPPAKEKYKYYRIQQVDLNGTVTIYDVKVVNW